MDYVFGQRLQIHQTPLYQIKYLDLIVEELTKDGAMQDSRLYQAPFTDVVPTGPETIFDESKVDKLFNKINEIRSRAVA